MHGEQEILPMLAGDMEVEDVPAMAVVKEGCHILKMMISFAEGEVCFFKVHVIHESSQMIITQVCQSTLS